MKQKINIAKLLKDCPKGMKLDCTCADNVVFDKIIEYEQIKCVIGECRDPLILDKYGRLLHICCPKCVIFPKGKTTWEGFHRPFKVGDVIQDEDGYKVKITEVNVEDECYEYESMIAKGIGGIAFSEQDDWILVPNKFDISALVPFESRVLVRDNSSEKWCPAIWGLKTNDINYPYIVVGGRQYNCCIPYESNEHLLGTTDDCDEYFKTWI